MTIRAAEQQSGAWAVWRVDMAGAVEKCTSLGTIARGPGGFCVAMVANRANVDQFGAAFAMTGTQQFVTVDDAIAYVVSQVTP